MDPDISTIFIKPLPFIDQLLQDFRRLSSASSESVVIEELISRSFQSLLKSNDSIYQIPSITHPLSPPESLPKESLVRFRCMIQDTGLGPELYSPQDPDGASMMYRESSWCSDSNSTYHPETLSERELYYGVSIPGEASWVQSELDGPPDRGLEHMVDALNLSQIQPSPKVDLSKLESTRNKYPFRGKKHIGALLKLYNPSDQELIKTSGVLEAIGVLDWSQFLLESDHESLVTGRTDNDSTSPMTSHIPCIHVIFCRPAPLPQLDFPSQQSERGIMMERLVNYLSTQVFQGDELAAQYLLAALTAKIHTRLNGFTIGALPLNLIYKEQPESASHLPTVLSSILPRLVTIPLTISSLNKGPLFPISNDSSLHSGPLQLSQGTTLLIDLRNMSEGQLNSMGVKNVEALKKVVDDGKLMYSFPYNTFEFDVEVVPIAISEGCKTFLEGFWPLPIHHSRSKDFIKAVEPTQEEFSAWRGLIQDIRNRQITIPESLSSEIQNTFVSIRRAATTLTEADKAMSQEDLSRRLHLSRLLGLRLGKGEVGSDDWQQACKLEKLRKIRLDSQ